MLENQNPCDIDHAVFSGAIVRYTWKNTNLRIKSTVDAVDIEIDVLARYVEELLQALPAVHIK